MTKLERSDLMLTRPELLKRQMAKWVHFGPDVLAAWVADMDFRAAPAITQALTRLIDTSDFGYGLRCGKFPGDALADAFVARAQDRYGWEVRSEQIQPVTELVQGLFDSVLAFSAPGEEIIVQGPHYDPFREAIEDSGRVMTVNHMLRTTSGWQIDLDHLDEAAGSASMMLFCHPQNPTGRAYSRSELEAVARIAEKHDIVVVSDEIWADLYLNGSRHIPFASLGPDVAERTVTLYSAGKSYSLAGLRGAVMHFGSAGLLERFRGRFPARSLGGMNVMGVDSTLAAWEASAEWLDLVVEQLIENKERITAWLHDLDPLITGAVPEATYLYWLDCSRLDIGDRTPQEFFLGEAGVALSPGESFGTKYSDHVRLNFATSPEILEEILDRMSAAAHRAGERRR